METFKISNCLFMTIMCIVRTDATVVVTEFGWLFRCQPPCIPRTDLEVEVEMLALEIRPNPTTYVFFSTLYRPPSTNVSSGFLSISTSFSQNKVTGLSNLLVTGDFNFSHVNWNICCPTCSDVAIFVIFLMTNFHSS